MKAYAVELKRTSYITVYIDAESKDAAIDKVWAESEYGAYDDSDASYDVSDVYEQFATDESRSSGTRSVPLKTLGQLEAENSDGFRNPERN